MKTLRACRFPSLIVALALCSAGPAALSSHCAEARTSGDSHFATSGTNRIHYVTVGTGGPVIAFIHGWGGNQRFWKEQVPALESRARLILIDLPGHGQSDKPSMEYSMDNYARAVIDVLRDAKIDKAALVGHSMGVVILCRVYALAPERVSALVAVDGLLRRPKIEPAQAEQFISPYRTPAYRSQVTNFIGSMFPNPGTDALKAWTLAEVLATPQHVLSSSMDAMFKADQPAWDLNKVDVPLLVINAKSPMWTSEYQSYVKSLTTRSEYRTIDGPGHFLMLEKPEEFNRLLTAFLDKQKF